MTHTERLFPGEQFISTVLDALESKTAMTGGLARVYVMRAAMAGAIAGVMYLVYFTITASLDDPGTGRLVGSLAFGFALVFIYFSKSELLTSTMMIVVVGLYHRKTTLLRALRILGYCLLGNAVGGLVIAVMVRYSTLVDGAIGAEMADSVAHKLEYLTAGAAGWGDLFVRAVLCNFMINLAMLLVFNGRITNDFTASVVMVMSVFVFAFVGFEHSVANTVLFTIEGLHAGIDWGLAAGNVGIVLLGNFVGGGFLIGWYYAYANDSKRFLRKRAVK